MNFLKGITILLCLVAFKAKAQRTDPWLKELLVSRGDSLMRHILSNPDTFQYQVIFTRIDRDNKGRPRFKPYHLNVDRNRYFNPASTVKLPTALAALEKLNRMKVNGVDRNTTMLTDSAFSGQSKVMKDTSSANGFPSVAHYIKKIFLTSDNDAYNRLYEFVGQETLNRSLQKKGYDDVRITRRFVPMTEEENRHTNPIRFVKKDGTIYSQPAAYSSYQFSFGNPVLIGRAHLDRNDSLILRPMDFTRHNNLPLEDLDYMMRSVMFPKSVPKKRRFLLTEDDRSFLYTYMSAYPSESRFPNYDTTEFFDSYTKFFFKAGRRKPPAHLKIYNKPGWSYGFLTDAAYVKDEKSGVEFLLSAVIYVNADGVLNDGKYEYEKTGLPFFGELFRVIYESELERKRQ
jgi:hypothetical protein